MWGSILGGLIGAVVGGAVTYYRQRKLKREREHEETVEEMVYDTVELCDLINTVTNDIGNPTDGVYPSDVHQRARKVVLKTTKLNDKELQEKVIKILNKNYDSPEDIFYEVYNLNREMMMRAYPVVAEVEAKVRKEDSKGMGAKMIGDTEKWPGPANVHFKNKLISEGATPKSDSSS